MKWILTFLLCLGSMLSFAQEAGGEISGSVLGPDFEPFEGAKIFIRKGDKVIKEYITDIDGRYPIEPLVPGTYEVWVVCDGYKKLEVLQVPVEEDRTTGLLLNLEIIRNDRSETTTIKYKQPKVLCKYPAHSFILH